MHMGKFRGFGMFETFPFENAPAPGLRVVSEAETQATPDKVGILAVFRAIRKPQEVELSPIEPPSKERHLKLVK